jgi:hypothetical protein
MKYTITTLMAALICAGCTTTGWQPPPGTTITVTGTQGGDITGTVTMPVSTNISVGGTITGNPDNGNVSGGSIIVFRDAPTVATAETMVAGGIQPINTTTWMLMAWDYKDNGQAEALQAALRDGARFLGPGAEVKFRVKQVQ